MILLPAHCSVAMWPLLPAFTFLFCTQFFWQTTKYTLRTNLQKLTISIHIGPCRPCSIITNSDKMKRSSHSTNSPKCDYNLSLKRTSNFVRWSWTPFPAFLFYGRFEPENVPKRFLSSTVQFFSGKLKLAIQFTYLPSSSYFFLSWRTWTIVWHWTRASQFEN